MPAAARDFVPVQPAELERVKWVLAGTFVSIFLGGCACTQFLYCFRLLFPSKSDPDGVKRYVQARKTIKWKLCTSAMVILAVALLFDVIIKICDTLEWMHNALIKGDPGIIKLPSLSLSITLVEGFIAFVVQIVYTIRLWAIWPTRGWTLAIGLTVAFVAAMLQFSGALWEGIGIQAGLIPATERTILPATCMWWVPAVFNDIFLCSAFCWNLRRLKTGFARTDDTVNKWTRFTLETGLLTSVVQVVCLVLFLGYTDKTWWRFPTLFLAEIYLNSILLLFQTMLTGGLSSTLSSSTIPGSSSKSHSHSHSGRPPASEVVISTEFVREEGLVLEMPDVRPSVRGTGEEDRKELGRKRGRESWPPRWEDEVGSPTGTGTDEIRMAR